MTEHTHESRQKMGTIEKLVSISSEVYGVDVLDKTRQWRNVWGRRAVMVALRHQGEVLGVIGACFDLDHSTVIASLRKHDMLYLSDRLYTIYFDDFCTIADFKVLTERQKVIKLINNMPHNDKKMRLIYDFIQSISLKSDAVALPG